VRIFDRTFPATLAGVSTMSKAISLCLEVSRVDTIDRTVNPRKEKSSLVSDVRLAVTELATNAVLHGDPKASELGLRIDLIGSALRIELRDDGGPFDGFDAAWKAARLKQPSPVMEGGRGLIITSNILHNPIYTAGPPNRLVAWRKLRRTRPALLFIEDDPELQFDVYRTFQPSFRVFLASSMEDAELILPNIDVDVIVAEYHLLGSNALKTHRVMNGLTSDEPPCPMILLKTEMTPDDISLFVQLDVEQCLQKPVTATELMCAVNLVLGNHSRNLMRFTTYFARHAGLLLPHESLREIPGYRTSIEADTASFGGGDFVLPLAKGDRTRLVLADVMGHGLAAKAGAISLASAIQTMEDENASPPGELLARLSRTGARGAWLHQAIATVQIVDFYPDGRIAVASAGHPPPALIAMPGSSVLPVGGALLGLFEDISYPTFTHQMKEGDRLVMVTDGADVHWGAAGDFPAPMFEFLDARAHLPFEKLRGELVDWLRERLGPMPRDDWTVILAEFAG
jgi:serine/threonine-protein kinase RsbW